MNNLKYWLRLGAILELLVHTEGIWTTKSTLFPPLSLIIVFMGKLPTTLTYDGFANPNLYLISFAGLGVGNGMTILCFLIMSFSASANCYIHLVSPVLGAQYSLIPLTIAGSFAGMPSIMPFNLCSAFSTGPIRFL